MEFCRWSWLNTSLSVARGMHGYGMVQPAMNGVIDAIEKRESKPWLIEIFDVAHRDTGPEAEALRRLHELLDEAAEAMGPFIELEVEVAEEVFSEEGILEEVQSALARQVAGK